MQKYTYVFKRKNSHDLLLKKYIFDSPSIFKDYYYIGPLCRTCFTQVVFFCGEGLSGGIFAGISPRMNKKKRPALRKSFFFCGCQDSNLEPFGS